MTTPNRLQGLDPSNSFFSVKNLKSVELSIVAEYIMSSDSRTLEHLDFDWSYLGEEGGNQIFKSLIASKYCKLAWLTLRSTGLHPSAIKLLGEYLISPSSSYLSGINLSGNEYIGDNEVKLLCSVLELQPHPKLAFIDIGMVIISVSKLILQSCSISDRGGILIELLLSNHHIPQPAIYVNYNNIDINLQRINILVQNNKWYEKIYSILTVRKSSSQKEDTSISNLRSDLRFKGKIDSARKAIKPLPPLQSTVKNKNTHKDNDDDENESQRLKIMISQYVNNQDRCSNYSVKTDIFIWRMLFLRCITNSPSLC